MNALPLHRDDGQALIEFAIIAPLAFFFFLGCVDLEVAMSDLSTLQYASQQTADCMAHRNPVCVDGQSFARSLATGFLDPAAVQVEIAVGSVVTVTTSYPYKPLGPFGRPLALSRSASAAMAPAS